MRIPTITRGGLLAALFLCSMPASAADFEIRFHEHVNVISQSTDDQLTFVAFGRQFDLELESNSSVLTTSRSGLLRGQLAGNPDSWARINRSAQRLSGVIWDGTDLWLIDSHRLLDEFLLQPDERTDNPSVIFPLTALSGDMGDLIVESWSGEPAAAAPEVVAASLGFRPGKLLDIGFVADARFSELNTDPQGVLLEMFNIVEGIFSAQVGVQFRAAEMLLIETDPPEIEGLLDPADLLAGFGEYKLNHPDLSALGLAHLFVTRNLVDANPPAQTVGVANIGTLCDPQYGVAITQATDGVVINALIAAHEIGHNFGAPHDAETGSVCEAESDEYIMAATFSGSMQFSECSIEQMLPEIAAATCTTQVEATDLQLVTNLAPPTSEDESGRHDVEFTLTNLSDTPALGVTLRLHAPGFSISSVRIPDKEDGFRNDHCEALSREEHFCYFRQLEPLESLAMQFSQNAEEPGTQTTTITVDSLNEIDQSDNELVFEVEVKTLARLTETLSEEFVALHPGESVRLMATVRNDGSFPVSDVVTYIQTDSDNILQLSEIDWPGCFVPEEVWPYITHCPIGTLSGHEEISFSFTIHLPEDADLSGISSDGRLLVFINSLSSHLSGDHGLGAATEITAGDSISDLSMEIQGPDSATVGEPAIWQFSLTNAGPDAAESIRIFSDNIVVTLPSANSSIQTTAGECRLTTANAEFECTSDSLNAGETMTISLSITPNETGENFWLEATAETSSLDANPNNNRAWRRIAVTDSDTPPPGNSTDPPTSGNAGGGGGGGGSTGILTLILLGAGIWVRSRRSAAMRPTPSRRINAASLPAA